MIVLFSGPELADYNSLLFTIRVLWTAISWLKKHFFCQHADLAWHLLQPISTIISCDLVVDSEHHVHNMLPFCMLFEHFKNCTYEPWANKRLSVALMTRCRSKTDEKICISWQTWIWKYHWITIALHWYYISLISSTSLKQENLWFPSKEEHSSRRKSEVIASILITSSSVP